MLIPIRNPQISWKFPDLVPVPADYQLAVGGSSLVSKTLYQRGLTSPSEALAFMDPDQYTPSPPAELPGLLKASNRLFQAIQNQEIILVWGDFDVDGQTSTTLLSSGLTELGALVEHHVPVRATESHGVSIPVLSQLIRDHKPRILLTCDTGIDALDAVDFANRAGVDVIITDHHQLPANLPEALAIINPNLLPPEHSLHNLPGVGVAYKLIEELFARFKKRPNHLLDLVALGIVADVAYQSGDTRYLLQRGLDILKDSPRPGLMEIYNQVKLQPSQITEESIGFVIGPRLNALGRLDDANSCVEFFTTKNTSLAIKLAKRLNELNLRRQKLTEKIFQEAQTMISSSPDLVSEYPIVVLKGPPEWNPGVIGIVASRLVERYQKPTIMLTEDGDIAKGSARSISGVPISSLVSACTDLLISHGGHPMAAGMSLLPENVSPFRSCLKEKYRLLVGDLAPEPELNIDAEILLQEISDDFVLDFQRLAPFGAGNPKLIFATRGVITNEDQIKTIGKTHKHRKITFNDPSGTRKDFLWWNSADLEIPDMPLDIAYTLELSSFRGKPQVQATLQHIRPSPDTPAYLPGEKKYKIRDLRNNKNAQEEIQQQINTCPTVIWAERSKPQNIPSVPRSELTGHDSLVIWTTPPNRLLLKQAIDSVSPSEILLYFDSPSNETLSEFIQSLLGLIKTMANTDKPFDLTRFSQALAYPEDVVEVGLSWIHHHGDFDLDQIESGILSSGPGEILPDFSTVDAKLKRMLQETISFREHFQTAHIGSIL